MPEYNRVVTRYENGMTEVKTYQFYQRYGYSVDKVDEIKHQSLVSYKSDLKKQGRIKGKKDDFKQENVQKNVYRAKNKIRQLCNNNGMLLTKFLTLTYADSFLEKDLALSNQIFSNFVKRINYQYRKKFNGLEYLCVPELQKSGRIHYHLLCNLPYIDVFELQKIWGYGEIYISKIDDINNLGAYLSSYVEKDFGKAFPGRKHFMKSKGVKYPVALKIDSEQDDSEYDVRKCVYYSENYNTFCGKVETNVFSDKIVWK